ncbi:MAG: DUF4290 domain-containing protein [Candidatus Shikimatogenerans bostrichidophilus]|nr:MAG: DUF4290 domain-containing protein [Candidatus Shikimatogenerans bostrichidophilus]
MKYYNKNKKIIIPEYGRNIQKLVEYTLKIKDKNIKKKNYKYILNLMKLVNKNKFLNLKIKFLYQLYLISNMKIKELNFLFKNFIKLINNNNKKIKYPKKNLIKFKYYGKIIQDFINKYIIYIKNKNKKIRIIKIIINIMRNNYKKWNNKYFINNLILYNDIKKISNKKLDIIKEYKNIKI